MVGGGGGVGAVREFYFELKVWEVGGGGGGEFFYLRPKVPDFIKL